MWEHVLEIWTFEGIKNFMYDIRALQTAPYIIILNSEPNHTYKQ